MKRNSKDVARRPFMENDRVHWHDLSWDPFSKRVFLLLFIGLIVTFLFPLVLLLIMVAELSHVNLLAFRLRR